MIVTTTNNIEGKQVVEYKGIVFGEVIAGVDFVKDFVAGLSNFFGGRSNAYEEELMRAREAAIQELQQRAAVLGADAVIGIDVDYEVLGSNNGMLMVKNPFCASCRKPGPQRGGDAEYWVKLEL